MESEKASSDGNLSFPAGPPKKIVASRNLFCARPKQRSIKTLKKKTDVPWLLDCQVGLSLLCACYWLYQEEVTETSCIVRLDVLDPADLDCS